MVKLKKEEVKNIMNNGKDAEKKEIKQSVEEDSLAVTRKEFKGVMKQLFDSVGQVSQGLMKDMNTLYGTHVFPYQLRIKVLEDIIIEHKLCTSDEINNRVNKEIKMIQDKALELKKKQDEE